MSKENKVKNFGLHHYMTKYYENGELHYVSWLQLDFGKWYRCFSVRQDKVKLIPVS